MIAEVAAWAKDNGKSLYQLLLDIYVEYGFSKEFTVNVVKPGKSGAEEIKAMMENFRANPPKELGGSKVILSKDYKTLKQTDDKGNVTAIDMPDRLMSCNISQKTAAKFLFVLQVQNRRSNSIWKYKVKWVAVTVMLLPSLLQWKRLKQ